MTRDLFTRDDYIFDAPPFDSCGAADYPAEPSFTDLGLEELEDRDISIEIGDVEIPF